MGNFYYPTRNEDGVYEWMLKDKFGNDIYCYYNGYTELHIKVRQMFRHKLRWRTLSFIRSKMGLR